MTRSAYAVAASGSAEACWHAGPECREKLIVFNERRGRVTTAWGSSGPSGAVAQMDHG